MARLNRWVRSIRTPMASPGDMVLRGLLDDVEFIVYQHDCVNGAAGEHSIVTSGLLGRVRMQNNGVVALPELRSWTQLLDRPTSPKPALTAGRSSSAARLAKSVNRANFRLHTSGFLSPSPRSAARMFESSTLIFRMATITATEGGYFAPGLALWETGDNAGQSCEVESFAGADSNGDAYVSLRFTAQADPDQGTPADPARLHAEVDRPQLLRHLLGSAEGQAFQRRAVHQRRRHDRQHHSGVNSTVSTGGTGEFSEAGMSRFLGPPLTDDEREIVFATSRGMLGTPYKHKGRRLNGTDCIGFLFLLFSTARAVPKTGLDYGRSAAQRQAARRSDRLPRPACGRAHATWGRRHHALDGRRTTWA